MTRHARGHVELGVYASSRTSIFFDPQHVRFLTQTTNVIMGRGSNMKPDIRHNTASDNSTMATSKITLRTCSCYIDPGKRMMQISGFQPPKASSPS